MTARPTPERTNQPLLGIAYVCLSAVLLVPLATASVKYLSGWLSVIEIVWIRAVGQTLCMLALFLPRFGWRLFVSRNLKLQLVRSALLFAATLCFTTGVREVPLATAHTIGFAAPLFVVLLAIPMLGEKVRAARWIAVLAGFGGVLIAMLPGAGGTASLLPSLLLLAAAGCWALVQTLGRRMAADDPPEVTGFYTYFAALLATSCYVPFTLAPGRWPSEFEWLAIVAAGFFGGLRHYFIVKGFALAPASLAAPFNYTELLGATLMGWLVFANLPGPETWIGAAIVIAAGLFLLRSERRT